MRLLLAGFEGLNNSAKRLLDAVNLGADKIYLHNDEVISARQIIPLIDNYDIVLVFGQKPDLKDKIALEYQAKLNDKVYATNYPIDDALAFLKISQGLHTGNKIFRRL